MCSHYAVKLHAADTTFVMVDYVSEMTANITPAGVQNVDRSSGSFCACVRVWVCACTCVCVCVCAGGSITSSQSSSGEQKLTLVYFLGGVTYAEIAALRFLAQQDDGNVALGWGFTASSEFFSVFYFFAIDSSCVLYQDVE